MLFADAGVDVSSVRWTDGREGLSLTLGAAEDDCAVRRIGISRLAVDGVIGLSAVSVGVVTADEGVTLNA